MRISVKGRYGLAAMIYIGLKSSDKLITTQEIAQTLSISKIYLEQVFSLLKRANLVTAVKGASGGYRLNNKPSSISVYDILSALEMSMFEKTNCTLDKDSRIENTLSFIVYDKLDKVIMDTLQNITLDKLITNVNQTNLMFYI